MNNEFNLRRKLFCRKLKEAGISRALVTNPSNIFYFTGTKISPYERFLGLLFNSELETYSLIVPELEKGCVWDETLKEVVYQDHEKPESILAELIGVSSFLGVEKKVINLSLTEKILDFLQQNSQKCCMLVDIGNWIEVLRTKKSRTEIEKIYQAAKFADEILLTVKNKINIGQSEKEIKFKLLDEISKKKGLMGEAFEIQVSSGVNSERPHGITGDRKVSKGDPIIIDFGVVFEHYRSDITRTFFIGTPEKQLRKIYDIVLKAQAAAIEKVAPGKMIKEIDLAARLMIKQAGYGQYFTHRTGHGIGIDIHEFPVISSNNENKLELGMVFSIEPGVYLPQIGGVRIEDDIVVTDGGHMVLTAFPKNLKEIVL